MIEEIIKYILEKTNTTVQDLTEDPDLKIEIAQVLAERTNIALPSALSELTAFMYMNTQYNATQPTSFVDNETTTSLKCAICEELIDKLYRSCFVCGKKMHINCGIADVNTNRYYCCEECAKQ